MAQPERGTERSTERTSKPPQRVEQDPPRDGDHDRPFDHGRDGDHPDGLDRDGARSGDRVDRESYREGYRDALQDQKGKNGKGDKSEKGERSDKGDRSEKGEKNGKGSDDREARDERGRDRRDGRDRDGKDTEKKPGEKDDKGGQDPDGKSPPDGKSHKASRLLLLVALAALVGGLVWFFHFRNADKPGEGGKPGEGKSADGKGGKGGNPADRVVPVVAQPVQKRDVLVTLSGLGAVTPLQTVALKSQVDGRLESVKFTEGQGVRKGELLAQIDARAYVIQQHQAEAALQRDQATLRNAKLQLERYVTLVKQQLLAKQTVDDQQTVVDQTEAAVKNDLAQIDQAKLLQDYARIVAPFDGVTGIRQIDPGNLVHASDANGIVVISQLDPIAVIFTLPQDDLPQVAEAMSKGVLTVDAFSRDGTAKLGTGTLSLIDNQVNASTSTIKLKASFPNPQRQLWPNAFVKARLNVSVHKDALVVPTPAIQHGPKGTFVYLVGDDKTAKMQAVELVSTEGDDAIVTNVQPGQLVVTDGQAQLKPGSKISTGKDKDKKGAGKDGAAPTDAAATDSPDGGGNIRAPSAAPGASEGDKGGNEPGQHKRRGTP